MKYSIRTLAFLLLASAGQAQTPGFSDVTILSGNPPAGAVVHNEFQLKRSIGNEDKPLRVNLSDDYALGTQDDTRGSVWLAAVVASMLSGKSLNGCEITVRFSGATEGPSAGGCLCLHFLSALTRKEFPDDTLMTGTITPDGGIGPVGGVPYKIYAAKKNGYKRVIIPAFTGMQPFKDPKTGKVQEVDPAQLGTRLGLEIKPVESIEEAYEYLYDTPIRRASASGPASYSPTVSSALRSDREALLQNLNSYTASPESVEKLSGWSKALGPGWTEEMLNSYRGSRYAAAASLLSRSHQEAAESIPRFMALAKVSRDPVPASPEEARTALKASWEHMGLRLGDVMNFTGTQKTFTSWPEIQLAGSFDDLAMIFQCASTAHKAAESDSNIKIFDLWALTKYCEYVVDAYSNQASPFSKTLAVLRSSDSPVHRQLDNDAVSHILETILTAARANAKTAETTGLQRAAEGMTQSQVWARNGKDYEEKLRIVEMMAKNKNGSVQQRIRSCFMAVEILADSSAEYIVFETVQVLPPAKKKEGESKTYTPPLLADPEMAARLVKVARKNAEGEIGRLVKRFPDAVLPIYDLELGDAWSGAGTMSAYAAFTTLKYYYRAYLAANLMDTFLDIEDGAY